MTQTLQAFFDSPLALAARYNLSASAAEPMTQAELFGLEPGSAKGLLDVSLNYPERHGPAALRAAVAARYHNLDADDIALTSGLDDGLGMLFTALTGPGDRVLVLMPCYPPQVQLPRWRGAELVPWMARPENNWVPDLDELSTLLEPRTRLVLVTFPQNPTGFMPDAAYSKALIERVTGTGALLVADEIYAGLPPLPPGHPAGLADQHPDVISLHGLSKTCGLPALRVGWLASRNRGALAAVREVRNLFNAYLPSPVAYMAELALRHEDEIVARNAAIVRANESIAETFFARRANLFEWRRPQAGVLSFPAWLGEGSSTETSDRLLREAGLTFAPSSCFEAGDRHFRMSTARRSFGDAIGVLDEFLDDAFPG